MLRVDSELIAVLNNKRASSCKVVTLNLVLKLCFGLQHIYLSCVAIMECQIAAGEFASRETRVEAPIVKQHVHDTYEHVDKTQVEEVHELTQVVQIVQPIKEEVRLKSDQKVVNDGTEVHEHGVSGLDSATEAELALRRQKVVEAAKTEHYESHEEVSARPAVAVKELVHIIEEVSRHGLNLLSIRHHLRDRSDNVLASTCLRHIATGATSD
jgi:hypothetical protein